MGKKSPCSKRGRGKGFHGLMTIKINFDKALDIVMRTHGPRISSY